MNCFKLSTQIFLPVLFVVTAAGLSDKKKSQAIVVNEGNSTSKIQQRSSIKKYPDAPVCGELKISSGASSLTLNANANFGGSVSSAGDVNGDGYSDVIIGAVNASNGAITGGGAFVYLGSASGNNFSSPDWSFYGTANLMQLGGSVANAGDVNGDGYSDVIVGAPGYTNGQFLEGKTFVFYGSASGLSISPSWSFESNVLNLHVGLTVRSAGDINGDGFSDILVGSTGSIYIFLGSSSGLNSSAVQVLSNPGKAGFGTVLSSAGDVNKDGFFDLLVGLPKQNTSGGITEGGVAEIYAGTTAGTFATTPIWTASGQMNNQHFGTSVSFAGDINGNGYSDILIGSPGWSQSLAGQGLVSIFYASSFGIGSTPSTTISGLTAGEALGSSVSSVGDINGNGYADFIIGSPSFAGSGMQQGKARLFQGGKNGVTECLINLTGQSSGDQFGTAVAPAGDVNGDGLTDFIIGIPFSDSANVNAGKVQLVLGNSDAIDTVPASTMTGTYQYENLGWKITEAGDLNGDGFGDIVSSEVSINSRGKISVYDGSPNGFGTTPIFTQEGSADNEYLGREIDKGGDINGDGYGDFMVSAPGYKNSGGEAVGAVIIYYGQSGLDVDELRTDTLIGSATSKLGNEISLCGDVNGDGYSDIIVRKDSTATYTEYVYQLFPGKKAGVSKAYSWQTVKHNIDFSIYTFHKSGLAGDVNGDGYSDVYFTEAAFSDGVHTGRVSVFYGSSHGLDSVASWVKLGAFNEYFGTSTSTAGDINGDGLGDLIVGSSYYTGNKFQEGKVDVFLGGSTGLSSTAFATILGDSTNISFGYRLTPVSDVNGDGYSDFLVGSANTFPSFPIGRVDLYLGNRTGVPSKSNWVFSAPPQTNYLAIQPASAGDVNNDGYADFLIGDPGFTNQIGSVGRVSGYLGGSGAEKQPYGFQLLNPSSSVISATNVIESSSKFIIAAPSFMGSDKAKIAIETKTAGNPFSSSANGAITNSVQYSRLTGSITMSKTIAIQPLFPKTVGQENKIRIRFKLDPVTALCGQVYTPWRYNIYYLAGQNIHNYAPKFIQKLNVPVKVFLQGSYTSPNIMKTVLAQKNLIPATQPYGDLLYGPVFKYYGNETNANMPSNAVDWVLVELRNQVTDTSLYKKAGLLLNTGQIVDADGSSLFAMDSVPPGDYYIIIKHRNHLSIASAQSVSLPNDMVYDFTTGASKAYSSGGASQVIFSDGLSGMVAGNSNINTNTRYIGISNDLNFLLNNTLGGNNLNLINNVYNASDLNMDGVVRYTGISNDNGFLLNTILSGNRLLIYSIQFPQ
jgi:hypothetical protein